MAPIPAPMTNSAAANDIRPQVAVNALLGLDRALIDYVRRRVLAGDDLSGLAAEVRKLAAAAFAQLEHGLGGYAAKPPAEVASEMSVKPGTVKSWLSRGRAELQRQLRCPAGGL